MIDAATYMMNILRLSVAALLLLSSVFSLSQAQDKPQNKSQNKPKAVSLDYCADQFILSLADRDQIMALTTDAVVNHSFFRDRARGLPLFTAVLEDVLHKAPDVVIRTWGGFKMLPVLKKANIPVATAKYGTDDKTLYQNMRLVAAALDQEQRAEQQIRDHQRRMAAVKFRATQVSRSQPIRVLYITPGGLTAGQDTFIDNIFSLAGLTSLSQEFGLRGWQPIPLENLIKNPPDLIIGSFFDQEEYHISSWSLSRHDLITKMINNIPTIFVPGRYLSCNGIFSVDAAEYIQGEVEKLFTVRWEAKTGELPK